MPIFEFTCRKCGHQFEELLTLADLESGELECPACSSKRVERGLSSFATGSVDSPPACSGGGCGAGGFT